MRVAETLTTLVSLTADHSGQANRPSSTSKPSINELAANTLRQLVVPNIAAEAEVNNKVAVSFSAGPSGTLQLSNSLTERQSYPPLPWDGSKPSSWKRDHSPNSAPDSGDHNTPATREIESRSDDAKPCVPTGLHGGHIGPDWPNNAPDAGCCASYLAREDCPWRSRWCYGKTLRNMTRPDFGAGQCQNETKTASAENDQVKSREHGFERRAANGRATQSVTGEDAAHVTMQQPSANVVSSRRDFNARVT
ncbi:hypothetical protein EJ03DRAFT_353628 [Teratosphaeria nubilosa]|uniref:Uncharacterized protein n=1 Tax=Teratosphaeria nubilosa TaxID=161662 RepID=A0A6G1L1Q7_9PEZI|nr:hypothetical protein EJ03DRAFT_353628 [Teratosphaeria nubilosa]